MQQGNNLCTCETSLWSSASTGSGRAVFCNKGMLLLFYFRFSRMSVSSFGCRTACFSSVLPAKQGKSKDLFLCRNERGQYKVYNMTLQGGHPLTQAVAHCTAHCMALDFLSVLSCMFRVTCHGTRGVITNKKSL